MIIAIRHGPVAADGICYGRWNPPLVNLPQNDADTILHGLADLPVVIGGGSTDRSVVRIVTSPADRCRLIAAQLATRLGLDLHEDERIAELSMGAWEGRPWTWLEQHDGERLRLWMEQWQTAAPPGGESLTGLESRVQAASDATDSHGPVIWITHAGVIRTLRVLFQATDWPTVMNSRVAHLVPEAFCPTG